MDKDCGERKWNGVFGGMNYVSRKHGREDARHGGVLFGWHFMWTATATFFFSFKESVFLLLCSEEEASKFYFFALACEPWKLIV